MRKARTSWTNSHRQLIGVSTSCAIFICSLLALSAPAQGETTKPMPSPTGEGIYQVKIVAHRGGKKWAPENTLAAFRKAVEARVDGIELDIHKCKTGELVVIHDDTLERTTNGAGLVKEKSLADLQKLDCGSWYDSAFKDERLPLLQDVLKLVDGKLEINIEIKNCPMNYENIAGDLLKLLESYKYPDKIMISSFDHKVIKDIAARSKRYKLALLGDNIPYDIAGYATKAGATAWNPAFDCVRTDSVKDAHDGNISVNTWTLNKREEWRKALDLKVDSIITDDPIGLREYLKERQTK
ncbi:MAG: hypothetical protein K2Y32_21235 [Candidatus Obscuribacterales bacterium]|nr:hypothetical protein [Candidatus Obscuribacterales bacterium]